MNIFALRTCVERRNKRTSKWTNYSTTKFCSKRRETQKKKHWIGEVSSAPFLDFHFSRFNLAPFFLLRGDSRMCALPQRRWDQRECTHEYEYVYVSGQSQCCFTLPCTLLRSGCSRRNFNLIRFVQSHYISDIERVTSVYPIFHSII